MSTTLAPSITESRVRAEDAAPVVHARACSACGAPVEAFDLYCNACGQSQEAAESVAPPPVVAHRLRCENCGAEVAAQVEQRSYTCPFCDSNYVVELDPQATGKQPPEFVIGFAIAAHEAAARYDAWLRRNNWFRPGDLHTAQVRDKLRGVYLPFWSFAMLAESRWTASIGEHWYRTETYTTVENGKSVTRTRTVTETEWWELSGNHHQYYSGFLVSGSRGLQQADAERIKPFHLAGMNRYAPRFLAGWLSEEYSVEREAALAICQEEFARREQANVEAFMPGDVRRNVHAATKFRDISSDLVLLPVYLLSYQYRGKLYRFLVNGQTGAIAGDKPLSWLRIGLAIGIGVTLIVLAVFLPRWLGR